MSKSIVLGIALLLCHSAWAISKKDPSFSERCREALISKTGALVFKTIEAPYKLWDRVTGEFKRVRAEHSERLMRNAALITQVQKNEAEIVQWMGEDVMPSLPTELQRNKGPEQSETHLSLYATTAALSHWLRRLERVEWGPSPQIEITRDFQILVNGIEVSSTLQTGQEVLVYRKSFFGFGLDSGDTSGKLGWIFEASHFRNDLIPGFWTTPVQGGRLGLTRVQLESEKLAASQ